MHTHKRMYYTTKSIFQNSNFSMHIIITWSLAREFITLSLTKYSPHHLCHYGSKLLCLNSKDNNGHSNSTSRNTVNLYTLSVNMIINTNTLHTIPTYITTLISDQEQYGLLWNTLLHYYTCIVQTGANYVISNLIHVLYFYQYFPLALVSVLIILVLAPLQSAVYIYTSYVPPAVFIVDNNCQLLTLCQLSTKSFYKYSVHLYYKHVRTELIIQICQMMS